MSKPASSPSESALSSRHRRTMNTWLLTVSAILLFVSAPTAYCWYRYQTKQLANSFLDRADQLLSERKPRGAAEYFQRYLQINPKDSKIRVRLAETYDESAVTGEGKRRTIELYYQALGFGESEGNADLRQSFKEKEAGIYRRLSELLLETGQYAAAEKESNKLLKLAKAKLTTDPQKTSARKLQSQAVRLQALAIYQQCRLGSWKTIASEKRSASEILAQALDVNPGDQDLLQILAKIYREEPQWLSEEQQSLTNEERNQRADQYMEELVQAHPQDPESLLVLYHYKEQYHLPKAFEVLEAAYRAGPQNPAVLAFKARAEQTAAQIAFSKNERWEDAKPHLESALEFYKQVLKVKPEDEDTFASSAEIRLQLGKPDEALQTCRAALEKNSGSIRLNLLMAQILLDQGETKEAARPDRSQGKERPLDQAERLIARLAILTNQEKSRQKQHAMQENLASLQQNLRLLRGRWHFQQGNMREALQVLQSVIQGGKTTFALQASFISGEIYGRLGQPEQAAKCYEDLVAINPQMPRAHRAAAVAWEMLGQIDLAEKHLRQAVEIRDTAANRFLLASMLFRREMSKPPVERKRDAFEESLNLALEAKVEADSPLIWQRELLAIQGALLRGQESKDSVTFRKTTLMKLQTLENSHSQTPALLAELISIYESVQASGEADRVLAELTKLKPQDAVTYLMRARLAIRRHQIDQARAAFTEGLQKVVIEERPRLQRELVKLELAENREADAAKQLEMLIEGQIAMGKKAFDSETARLILVFAEQALNKHDARAAKHWEDALIKLEGPEGTLWRYVRSRRLIDAARNVNNMQFAEADRLQTELRKMRPSWAPGYLLAGIVLQRRGQLGEAVDAYQSAIRLGYRQLAVYEPLVALLHQLGRYGEAERCLAELREQLPESLFLSSIEISRAAGRGQWQQAIELARRTAEAQPQNVQAQLWLGRLLEMDNQMEAASAALEKAVHSHSKESIAHYQLLAHYVRRGKIDLAKAHLEKLAKNADIPQVDLARLLAQGYELVYEDAKAKEAWKTVAVKAKDTAAEQTALADQIVDRDPQAAEKALRRSLQLDANCSVARLKLAKLLASRGGEAEWNEALDLLSGSLTSPSEERARQFLLATLYVSRGGKKNLQQARAIVEGILSNPKESRAEEILLWVKICESEGNLEAAKTRLQALVESSANPAVSQVTAYVELLMRQPMPHDAELRQTLLEERERWINKLQMLAPRSSQSIALTARWLKESGRQAEVEPLIEAWAAKQRPLIAKNPQEETKFLELIGSLYTSLDVYPAAERWYRKAVEQAADHYPALAHVLARQGRYEEALQLCQNAAVKDSSSLPVLTTALLLAEGHPSAKDFANAEKLLGKAAETYRDQADVLNALAAVMILQERTGDAAVLYRRVLELQPGNVAVMNNLATVLAEQPDKLSEGKELIEKAIAMAGPQAELLDVKGILLLAEKKVSEAVSVLEEAAAASQADPRYSFHLAAAYLRAGKPQKARQAFQRALDLKLDRQILTPGDKKIRNELEQAFKGSSTAT